MAIATKTKVSLEVSTTVSAGSGDIYTGSSNDLSTALGALITASIINGATPPSAFDYVVDASAAAAGPWFEISRTANSTTGSATTFFTVVAPTAAMYLRIRLNVPSGSSTEDVTLNAEIHELTSIQ